MRKPRNLTLSYLAPDGIVIPMGDLRRWMAEHAWKARAQAYDKHLDELHREEVEEQVTQHAREVAAEHLAITSQARDLISREVAKLLNKSRESSATTIKPRELTALLDLVVKADRLIRGDTTENVKSSVDLSALSNEELQVMADLAKKAGAV